MFQSKYASVPDSALTRSALRVTDARFTGSKQLESPRSIQAHAKTRASKGGTAQQFAASLPPSAS
jgi:hypothetical protein